jgi:hypothetical protein
MIGRKAYWCHCDIRPWLVIMVGMCSVNSQHTNSESSSLAPRFGSMPEVKVKASESE